MVPETDVAEICHALLAVRSRQVGDVLPPWDELPGWWRDLAADVVRLMRRGDGPRESHSLFAAALIGAGWGWGPWDVAGRSCPWLCSWAGLSPHGRAVFRLWHHVAVALSVELPDDVGQPAA